MAANRVGQIQESARVFGATIGAVVIIASFLTPVPFGLGVWLTVLLVGVTWPKPEMQPLDSPQEKAAKIVRAVGLGLVNRKEKVFGFGDPGTARGHEPSRTPRLRVTSWQAAVVGVLFVVADLSIADLTGRHPIVVAPLSWVFGFAVAQAVHHAKRETAHDEESAPPAMWDPEVGPTVLRQSLLPMGVAAAGGLIIPLMVFRTFGTALWVLALQVVSAAAFAASCIFVKRYKDLVLAEWREEMQTRAEWEQRWAAIPRAGNNPPTWILQHDLPPENPTHTTATFAIPPGADFGFFEETAPKLGPALASDMIAVGPMPAVDETGRPIPGSTQYSGFTVTWATAALGHKPHMRADLDPLTQRFAIRWSIVAACKQLGLGRPELAALRTLTAPNEPNLLVESQWRLDPAITYDKFAAKAAALQEKLEVPWLRVGRRESPNGQASEFVSIVHGDNPATLKLRPREAKHLHEWIDQLDWAAYFRAAKIIGSNGQPPHLLSKFVNDREIAEMEFTMPDGHSLETIKKAVPALSGTSGYSYIAVEELDDSTVFRMVAGRYDPLAKSYLFVDYPQLLTTPVPGKPKIDWAVGPGADGELMTYRWRGEIPHMLIAGASGMGKSSVLNAMILQMAHNCHPRDLEFWFIEPKNELGQFANFEHVTHYVDMLTPGEPMENVTALYRELREEMDRRYRVMSQYGALDLSDARLVANREGAPEGQRHPLDLPYIICVMEECATYLGDPLKKDRELRDELVAHCAEIARKARAAGIYLVFATQYPTNANLPSTIRQQCRRVGLGVSTQIASQVIIDEPGLETINIPGRGMMTWGKTYREFRSVFLRKPNEEQPDEPDDRLDIMRGIPQVQDRVFGPSGHSRDSELLPPPSDIWETGAAV